LTGEKFAETELRETSAGIWETNDDDMIFLKKLLLTSF